MLVRKVLILVENLSVPFDRRVWMEARALKENGKDVSIICPRFRKEKSFELLEGITIYRYSKLPFSAKGVFGHILEYLYSFIMISMLSAWVFIRHNFDVIHACNPPDIFFILGLFYKIFGKKFYFDQHDICPELYLAKYENRGKDFLYSILLILEYLTYKTADKVIVTNNSYRDIAISRGRLTSDKVSIVRSGIELDKFKKLSSDIAIKREKKFLVTYLGIMSPQDGVDYLLLAIDIIVRRYKRNDILFNIIGNGDSFEDLCRLKDELKLNSSVIFTDRMFGEDLFKYLSTSDLCVAPDPKNAFNDNSTMSKLLEYMAMARPIVCFNLKESRYLAGDAALYVRPNDVQELADKILELLEDPESRNKMGMAGYNRLKKEFSWDFNKVRLLETYGR